MELETQWQQEMSRFNLAAPITGEQLEAIISSRVLKELGTVSGYIWALVVYQLILYSFLAHTLVRNWGSVQITVVCLVGAALYIPLTAAFIRRTRALYGPILTPDSTTPSVRAFVTSYNTRLVEFFRFKKRMDWLGVPASCAIIVFVTFTLFVPGGIATYPSAAVVLFAVWVAASVIAIHFENVKRFVAPLRQFEALLQELDEPDER